MGVALQHCVGDGFKPKSASSGFWGTASWCFPRDLSDGFGAGLGTSALSHWGLPWSSQFSDSSTSLPWQTSCRDKQTFSLSTAAPHRLLPTELKMPEHSTRPSTGPTFYCQSAYKPYTVICTSAWTSFCDTFWVSTPRNATFLWSLYILDGILQISL